MDPRARTGLYRPFLARFLLFLDRPAHVQRWLRQYRAPGLAAKALILLHYPLETTIMIIFIESSTIDTINDTVTIEAYIDEARLVYVNPDEYVPAMCRAVVECEAAEWPNGEDQQKAWLANYDPDWQLLGD
jgi:hypothetical protein